MINITDNAKEQAIIPILRLAFRPFFLLGSGYAIVAISIWVWMFNVGQPSLLQVPAVWWHVHEMLFGFSMAIVVGFVLTAIQNWTGVPGTKGYRLGLMVALWLLARLLFWMPVSIWVICFIESLFLLYVAYEIGYRIVVTKGWRNLFFLPLFLLAIGANIASYSVLDKLLPFSASDVWQAMMWWFTLLLSVMGGRVIPFFTARKLNFSPPIPIKLVEWGSSLVLSLLFILSFSPTVFNQFGPSLMLVAGGLQTIRLFRWKPWKTIKVPLLWSLHLAYFCIPMSLILRGLSYNHPFEHHMLHLFVIGALAGLILSMTTRVTMGHTGRAIYQGPNMMWGFVALMSAAMCRSIMVGLFPNAILLWVNISAILWGCAFGYYLLRFGKMLVTKRVDGYPG